MSKHATLVASHSARCAESDAVGTMMTAPISKDPALNLVRMAANYTLTRIT